MSNTSPPQPTASESSGTLVVDEVALQVIRMLREGLGNGQTQNPNSNTILEKVVLSVKLDGENYSLWSQLMEVEIDIRGLTGHITDETVAPAVNDATFLRWKQEDLRVFSWVL